MSIKDIISLYEAGYNKPFPFSTEDVETFEISSNLERSHIHHMYEIRYSNYLDKKPRNVLYELLLANLKNHKDKYINICVLGYETNLIVIFLNLENNKIIGVLGDSKDNIKQ